jgi:hypothetical protein
VERTYRFPALPIVGTYTLEVDDQGIQVGESAEHLIASVGQVNTRDMSSWKLVRLSDQVTVEAGAQLVQTEDSVAFCRTSTNNVWTNMPLETRSRTTSSGWSAGAEPAGLKLT